MFKRRSFRLFGPRFAVTPRIIIIFFFHASLFPRLSDRAAMMAGVGNAFLLAMIELVAQKRRNEP